LHHYQHLVEDKADFRGVAPTHTPFLIGISGSVAVGKSTTARLLQLLLSRSLPNSKVQLITTDGFCILMLNCSDRGFWIAKVFPKVTIWKNC
jgi:Panthothenate kinase